MMTPDDLAPRSQTDGGNTRRSRFAASLRTTLGIMVSPNVSLHVIRERRPWVGVFLVLVFGTLLQGLVARPYVVVAMSDSLAASGAPSSGLETVLYDVTLALSPVLITLGWLLDAAVIWLLAVAFGSQCRFGQAFSVSVHLAVVSFVGGVAGVVLFVGSSSFGAVPPIENMTVAPSLNLLVSAESAVLEAVYGRLNPFSIWAAILLALASHVVFELPKGRGVAMTAVHWLGTTALLAALAGVSESLMGG